MGVNALQNVFEISPGVDFVFAAGSGKGHQDRRSMAACLAADKQPVLASQGNRPYGILRKVVVNGDTPIG